MDCSTSSPRSLSVLVVPCYSANRGIKEDLYSVSRSRVLETIERLLLYITSAAVVPTGLVPS